MLLHAIAGNTINVLSGRSQERNIQLNKQTFMQTIIYQKPL